MITEQGPGADRVEDWPVTHRRRWPWLVLVVALAAAGTAIAVNARSGTNQAADLGNSAPTAFATVTEGTLSAQVEVDGTLGYAGNHTVIGQAQGVYTWLPAQGQVIRQGQVLYQVSESPVVLLYGRVPAYRSLYEGDNGPDVAELNADLVALGDTTWSEVGRGSDWFSAATASGVDKLQSDLGATVTGSLAQGAFVVEPSALRVASITASLGAATAPGPVLQATSTDRQVVVNLDASQQAEVASGDAVTITMPGNSTTPGTVTSVGKVASSASSPASSSPGTSGSASSPATVQVDIAPSDSAATGILDQAPVQVTITSQVVRNALAVPVTALLGTTSGGYVVEVAEPRGRYAYVPVTLGIFDDAAGLVQVSGTLQPGEKIVEAQT